VDRPPSRPPPRGRQAGPLHLHPCVHEQEASGHIKDPQLRIPRRGFLGQWLFVLQAHALSEPLRALPSILGSCFAQTLAREGWLLIVSENTTLS